MTSRGGRRRSSQPFSRRSHGPVLSGNVFLVVTEGAKTEPGYFRALREHLHLASANVVVEHPEGTDPVTLTTRAIELKKEREREAKQGDTVPYDQVWVVFDLEKVHDERRALAVQAMEIGKKAGIRFADSDPCFEYWLLLHYEYTTRPCDGCSNATAPLKRHWSNYEKGSQLPTGFLDQTPTAVQNAEKCREHHYETGGGGNPSTRVDILVRQLNEATRPERRLPLP